MKLMPAVDVYKRQSLSGNSWSGSAWDGKSYAEEMCIRDRKDVQRKQMWLNTVEGRQLIRKKPSVLYVKLAMVKSKKKIKQPR